MLREEFIPVKAKNLKVIDHLGTLYATFNGSSIWRIDKVAFGILKLCDGKKTIKQLIKEVADKIGFEPKHVKRVVLEILEELRRKRFIEIKKKV